MSELSRDEYEAIAELTQRYLMGEMSAHEAEQFNLRMASDVAAADAFVEIARQCVAMREVFANQHQLRSRAEESSLDLASFRKGMMQADGPMMTAQALAELARLHEEGMGGPIDLDARRKSVDKSAHGPSRRTRLQARLIIMGGLAAVIALGVLIAIVVGSFAVSPTQVAQTPKPAPPRVVATLTDTHDATWLTQEGMARLEIGEQLRNGQRLTLASGMAELTTLRGAVVILEAPTTFELLNHDNAVRLIEGRLVGLCDTDASKGLVIRTSHMKIKDLSTRFGVSVDDKEVLSTVFNGSVEVNKNNDEPRQIEERHTARLAIDQPSREILVEPRIDDRFASMLDSELYLKPLERFRPRLEGFAIKWGGRVPHDLRLEKRSSNKVQVFLEREDVLLKDKLVVDLNPDVTTYGADLPPASIPSGSRVNVYMVHLDLIRSSGYRAQDLAIHFDQPILGVIASGDKLDRSDDLIGDPGVLYPLDSDTTRRVGRGLEFDLNDRAEIDGRTLRLKLVLSDYGIYLDQIRVLVQSDEP